MFPLAPRVALTATGRCGSEGFVRPKGTAYGSERIPANAHELPEPSGYERRGIGKANRLQSSSFGEPRSGQNPPDARELFRADRRCPRSYGGREGRLG